KMLRRLEEFSAPWLTAGDGREVGRCYSRLRSPPTSSLFSTPNRAAAASAAGRWVPAMPTSLTPDTWVKCWSANSPNPPQPLTPNRMRSSSIEADPVDLSTRGDSFSRVRPAGEGLNRRPLYLGAGLDLQDAPIPDPERPHHRKAAGGPNLVKQQFQAPQAVVAGGLGDQGRGPLALLLQVGAEDGPHVG